ncbi:MAG: hypothetical protein NVS9B10_21230 [Nevskia sp.]
MKHGRTAHFLLALAFVLGQWFAVVHATQHELNAADRLVACEVCAVGHASGAAPLAAAPALALLPSIEAPQGQRAPAVSRKPIRRPPTRGPPALLA